MKFLQCFSDIISCATNSTSQNCTFNISNITALSVLRMSDGSNPTIANNATSLSFTGCKNYCESSQVAFSWAFFSRQYCTWLLPYLALLSQLPYGARRRMDNFMAVILTLGSPTLAGYSLFMTLLNARWLNDQLFSGVDYPNPTVRQSVVQTLSSLQQVPLRVHPGSSGRFESLVVHPANDQWWSTFAKGLNYSHTWSIASATSVIWVVIAYLLTVADSFSGVSQDIGPDGQGAGSIWLWLLPIVVGWLILSPKCDYDRVHEAYDRANGQVFVPESHGLNADPIQVTSDFGLTISSSPDWTSSKKNITSPDELRIPPVFNYARTLSWCRNVYIISLFYRTAWRKSNVQEGVDGHPIRRNVCSSVPRESRLGSRDQIIPYCRPDDREYSADRVLWPRGVLLNMVKASVMSLLLQWGTTVSAVLVVWYTPTVGLGCRSLSYLTYGVLSTVVWLLLVFSSTLGYYAQHLVSDLSTSDLEGDEERKPSTPRRPSKPTLATSVSFLMQEIGPSSVDTEEDTPFRTGAREPARTTAIKGAHARWIHVRTMTGVADWLRWIGKSLAIINGIGIIVVTILQYASVFATCYCNSNRISLGAFAFFVVLPDANDIRVATSIWIGALVLGLTSCAFFIGMIYLLKDSLPS